MKAKETPVDIPLTIEEETRLALSTEFEDKQRLMTANLGLAFFTAQSFLENRHHDDEVFSVANLALWKAAQRFKPAGRARFRTYALRCIHGALVNLVKKEGNRLSRTEPLQEAGLPKYGVDYDDRVESNEHAKAAQAFYQDAKDRLTQREREILEGHLDGKTFSELSKQFGVNRSSVARVWKTALAKMKNAAKSNETLKELYGQ